MESKSSLQGAGLYYFALHGAKEQPIFQSVFEYDYALQALAQLPNTKLLAYVFDNEQIQCVLRVKDSQETLHDLHNAFDTIHERCWNKRRQVLSEQARVLWVDEQAYLVELILQLHNWPCHTGKVVAASLWPYSSDRYYRLPEPPSWLDSESMLNLLCHSRRNRHQHYQAVMSQPIPPTLDLHEGNHPQYYALARPSRDFSSVQSPPLVASKRNANEIQQLFQQACQLVAAHFSVAVGDLQDKNQRRRFHHLMPLVVWLLRERGLPFDELAKLTDEDEVRLELWLRGLWRDHSEHTKNQLLANW